MKALKTFMTYCYHENSHFLSTFVKIKGKTNLTTLVVINKILVEWFYQLIFMQNFSKLLCKFLIQNFVNFMKNARYIIFKNLNVAQKYCQFFIFMVISLCYDACCYKWSGSCALSYLLLTIKSLSSVQARSHLWMSFIRSHST